MKVPIIPETYNYIIAAVSGGPDSMAMLNLYRNDINKVVHFNYYKRSDSWVDENIVSEYCMDNNIELECINLRNYISKGNFQKSAREIRYEILSEIADNIKHKKVLIMIGHNRNDHIETAVMQLFKSDKYNFIGIEQLVLIRKQTIWRPLISFSKDSLKNYCNKVNIKFAVDSSNSTDIYKRNIIRKHISYFPDKFNDLFFDSILKRNNDVKKSVNSLNDIFKDWKEKKYSVEFFNNLSKEEKIKTIYNFFSFQNVKKISLNKILGSIQFIESKSSKGNYRIGENKNLIKEKDHISLTYDNIL